MNRFISCKELFPELADKTNKERYIEFLSHKDYKKFTKLALDKANYELTDNDLQLCKVICDVAIEKGMLWPPKGPEGRRNHYLDHLLIAAMLRNTYKDDKYFISSLFRPREEFRPLIYEEYEDYKQIHPEFFEQLCQLIEAQYGIHTPVELCLPAVGSMQATFSTCVYISEYLSNYMQERLDKYDN